MGHDPTGMGDDRMFSGCSVDRKEKLGPFTPGLQDISTCVQQFVLVEGHGGGHSIRDSVPQDGWSVTDVVHHVVGRWWLLLGRNDHACTWHGEGVAHEAAIQGELRKRCTGIVREGKDEGPVGVSDPCYPYGFRERHLIRHGWFWDQVFQPHVVLR